MGSEDDSPSDGETFDLLPLGNLYVPPAADNARSAGPIGDAADPIPSLRRSVVFRC